MLGVIVSRGERVDRLGGSAAVSSSQARVLGVALRVVEVGSCLVTGTGGDADGGVGPAAGARSERVVVGELGIPS